MPNKNSYLMYTSSLFLFVLTLWLIWTLMTEPVLSTVIKYYVWDIQAKLVEPPLAGGAFCIGIVRIFVLRHTASTIKRNIENGMYPCRCSDLSDWEAFEATIHETCVKVLPQGSFFVYCCQGIIARTQVVRYSNAQWATVITVCLKIDIHHSYFDWSQLGGRKKTPYD